MTNYGITLDNFGFHTFSVLKQLESKDEYERLAEIITKYHHIPKDKNEKIVGLKNKSNGVLINLYKNGKFPPNLEVTVNPRVLLGDTTYIGIFNSNQHSIQQVQEKLDEILQLYGYTFEEMILTRIYLCVNVYFDNTADNERYMKVVNKTQIPTGFKKVVFDTPGEDNKEKNKHSWCIQTNSYGFKIYDKIWQMGQENLSEDTDYKSILRFEIMLKRDKIYKILNKFEMKSITNTELLMFFGGKSREFFEECFTQLFPEGDYMSYQTVNKIINESPIQTKLKERMLKFIQFSAAYQSLHKALTNFICVEDLTEAQRDKMLDKFELLRINPVTVPMEILPNEYAEFSMPGVPELLGLE